MGNMSKRQQPDQRADNSRRQQICLQRREIIPEGCAKQLVFHCYVLLLARSVILVCSRGQQTFLKLDSQIMIVAKFGYNLAKQF